MKNFTANHSFSQRSLLTSTLLAGSLLTSAVTNAADKVDDMPFYIEGSLGSSSYSSFKPASGYDLASESRVDSSWSLGSGLELSNLFSIGITFHQFGKHEGTFLNNSDSTSEKVSSELKSTSIALIPTLPLGEKSSVFLEFGHHLWQADQASSGSSTPSNSSSFDGGDSFYGFGFGYKINDKIVSRVKFSEFNLDNEDFKNIALSLAYKI